MKTLGQAAELALAAMKIEAGFYLEDKNERNEVLLSAIEDLREALAEHPAQQEPVAWQPIESAPQDGTMVLVCLPRHMNIVVRAWYNRIHSFWQTDYEVEGGGITRPTYFHKGDLWHPIPPLYPAPPAAQRKPLTDEEIDALRQLTPPSAGVDFDIRCRAFARAIEAAHGIKENT